MPLSHTILARSGVRKGSGHLRKRCCRVARHTGSPARQRDGWPHDRADKLRRAEWVLNIARSVSAQPSLQRMLAILAEKVATALVAGSVEVSLSDLPLRGSATAHTDAGDSALDAICAPVDLSSGRVIGLVRCFGKRGGSFNDDDVALLRAACREVAPILRQRQQIDTLRFGNRQLCQQLGDRNARLLQSDAKMRSAAAEYMNPALADHLLGSNDGPPPTGRRSTTILFADIREFTRLSQEMGLEATVELLNEYFSIIVDCLDRHGGALDKFIGDAAMATFGMQHPTGDEEDRAVMAALAILRRLTLWNEGRVLRGLPQIEVSIGINSDHVIAGTIGAPSRRDYTVIGDGVNVASHLQRACKGYGIPLLISENTRRRLRQPYSLRSVDLLHIRGRREPIEVFAVTEALFADEQQPRHEAAA